MQPIINLVSDPSYTYAAGVLTLAALFLLRRRGYTLPLIGGMLTWLAKSPPKRTKAPPPADPLQQVLATVQQGFERLAGGSDSKAPKRPK